MHLPRRLLKEWPIRGLYGTIIYMYLFIGLSRPLGTEQMIYQKNNKFVNASS